MHVRSSRTQLRALYAACAAVLLTAFVVIAPGAAATTHAMNPWAARGPSVDGSCTATQSAKQVTVGGLSLVCTEEFGTYTWRLGPDEVSRTAHARFMEWVRPYVEGARSSGTGFPVIKEPGYPDEVANSIIAAMDAAKTLRGAPDERAVIVLGTTPEWMYSQLSAVVAPYAGNATQNERDIWEMENALFRWRTVGQGAGHAGGLGGAPQAYFSYLSHEMGVDAKTSPAEAVEGMLREYLMHSPILEEGNFDGNLNRSICWQAESTAWNVTMAVMDVLKYPGFDYASRWAHWVSDLANIRGAYQPGLAASEKLISPQNGVSRYDMPCQWQGVGHTQGFLAREWLMARVGPGAYAAYPPLSRQANDVRASLQSATGVAWDQWYAESDARTAALLNRYPSSHKLNITIGPDGQTAQTPGGSGSQNQAAVPAPGNPIAVYLEPRGARRGQLYWQHGSGLASPQGYEWRLSFGRGKFGPWHQLPGEATTANVLLGPNKKTKVELRAFTSGGPSRTITTARDGYPGS